MRRTTATAVLLVLVAACAGEPPLPLADSSPYIVVTIRDPGLRAGMRAGASGPRYQPREVYQPSINALRTARRIASTYKLTRAREWPIRPLGVYCLVYAVPANVSIDELLAELNARADVDSAQILQNFQVLSTSADPYRNLQHTLETLELSQAHAWSTGSGSHVTVVDTGADIAHPELRGQVDEYINFVDTERSSGSDRHGTAVAGVIAAAAGNGIGIVGIAPAARLSVLQACWEAPGLDAAQCNTFTLARALGHAIESQTDVINLSLSGPPDPLLSRLATAALRRGMVIVAAAPPSLPAGFPAATEGVLAVDAGDSGERGARAGRYPLAAPGVDILVPLPRGGFDYASGSSLAAAQVSGVAALLLAREPSLSADDIRSLLLVSRNDDRSSVNACRALAELLSLTGCRPVQTAAIGR